MRFKSTISLVAQGEQVRREAGFWDRFKQVFGKNPKLETDRVQTLMTTAHLLAGIKKTLDSVGITNAIVLVIDSVVLFRDEEGKADDVGELFSAFYENEQLYGGDFGEVMLVVEHREAGLHFVLDLSARGEHKTDESTVDVLVSARIADLEPRPGEDPKTFESRIVPLLGAPAFTEGSRLQFESFIARTRSALVLALPDAKVSVGSLRTFVERPSPKGAPATPGPIVRDMASYDPHPVHCPNPMQGLVDKLLWGAMLRWAWHPSYEVVDASGAVVGCTDVLTARQPAEVGDDEVDAPWDDDDAFSAEPPGDDPESR